MSAGDNNIKIDAREVFRSLESVIKETDDKVSFSNIDFVSSVMRLIPEAWGDSSAKTWLADADQELIGLELAVAVCRYTDAWAQSLARCHEDDLCELINALLDLHHQLCRMNADEEDIETAMFALESLGKYSDMALVFTFGTIDFVGQIGEPDNIATECCRENPGAHEKVLESLRRITSQYHVEDN